MAKNPSKSNSGDDFVTRDFVTELDDQAQKVNDLSQRISNIEKKFGTHEQIAETLYDTAQKQIKMQTMLADTFASLLEKDSTIKEAIQKTIDTTDRRYTTTLLKRFGSFAVKAFIGLISLIAGIIIRGFFPPH